MCAVAHVAKFQSSLAVIFIVFPFHPDWDLVFGFQMMIINMDSENNTHLTLTSDEFNFGVHGTSIPKRITNDDWKMKLILLTYKRPFYHIGRLCPATSKKRGGFNHSRVQIIDVVFFGNRMVKFGINKVFTGGLWITKGTKTFHFRTVCLSERLVQLYVRSLYFSPLLVHQ